MYNSDDHTRLIKTKFPLLLEERVQLEVIYELWHNVTVQLMDIKLLFVLCILDPTWANPLHFKFVGYELGSCIKVEYKFVNGEYARLDGKNVDKHMPCNNVE